MKSIALASLVGGAIALSASPAARAGSVTFNMDSTLSGDTVPGGSTLTAVVSDYATNEVKITMDATNLAAAGTQFVSDWGFNIDPSISVTSTNFKVVPGSVSTTGNVDAAETVSVGTNTTNFNPNSAGHFDLVFDWTGSDHSFTSGSTISYILQYTGTGTLDADSFNFPTTLPVNGDNAYSLAKIQGFSGSGELGTNQPGVTSVPEPSSLVLAGIAGLVGLGVIARRRRNQSSC